IFSEYDKKNMFNANEKVEQEEKQYLAMINGKREFGIQGPMLTELCYGNMEVRKRMVQHVANYAEVHPEVDMLHFWLSDKMNVHCECELCCDTRPSDFYVMLLNGMDEEFTRRGLKTRIVFLIYTDLLWFPEKESIKNPDRFVMMFAPIARKYSKPYDYNGDDSLLPQFIRNQNTQPSEIGGYIASLRGWKKHFRGEAFAFDYHMTRHHYYDQGYYGFTKVLTEDIRRLPSLGLSGFVSCQILRSYFPTGFPVYLHARLLWNPKEDTGSLASGYFDASFGTDGGLCLEYMKKLSELFVPDYFYKYNLENCSEADRLAADKLAGIPGLIENFRPVIERNMNCDNKTWAQSWEYLFIHMEIALMLAHALHAKAEGRQEVANAYWIKTVEYIMINESRIQSVFDPSWFCSSFEKPKLFKQQIS
ncbi:MAG: DUF4838 domain-containing protein, partial [Clostridiales bacterium]|nr:DUF4838 domain-containing protein [Clostridiales bacterium]